MIGTLCSVWLFLSVGCFMTLGTESINTSEPIDPVDYQKMIGHGFAVKYFSLKVPMLSRYDEKNIDDVYNAGFRNLRLRCNAWQYPYPYNSTNFTETFLNGLETVVDRCLEVGVIPIISWSHPEASNFGTEEQFENYIRWWQKVATKLQNKDYRLGFNLVTELNRGECKKHGGDCSGSLHTNHTKYNIWMETVRDAIRATGGNNKKRILLLGPPKYTAKGYAYVDSRVYENDNFMMAEFHKYAGGPTKKAGKQQWEGNGTAVQRQNLYDELDLAEKNVPLKGYFGAWMPIDNKGGSMTAEEALNFAEFFVSTLRDRGIPWSLNALEMYYDTEQSTWLTGLQNRSGVVHNMSALLNVMQQNML